MNKKENETLQDMAVKIGRIDERTANTYRLTENQEAHLREINGSLLQFAQQIAANTERSINNAKWIGRLWKIGLPLILAGGTGFSKWAGLW